MIAMLDYLKLDMEVSDTSMKTTESNNYRGMPRKNGDTNGMLAVIWEEARFSCKDGWKFINPFT